MRKKAVIGLVAFVALGALGIFVAKTASDNRKERQIEEFVKSHCPPEPCYEEADRFQLGAAGLLKDPDRAAALFRTAHLEACSIREAYDDLKKQDLETAKQSFLKALELYDRACANGDFQSCLELADIYRSDSKPEVVATDRGKAYQFYERAAELLSRSCYTGAEVDCFVLERLYDGSERYFPSDLAQQRVEEFKLKVVESQVQLCDTGNAEVCKHLEDWYQSGLWVGKDLEKAKEFGSKARDQLVRACDNGGVDACNRLLDWIENGDYGEPTSDEARELLSKAIQRMDRACDNGEPKACVCLASLYGAESLVGKDHEKESEHALLKACQLGLVSQCPDQRPVSEWPPPPFSADASQHDCEIGNALQCFALGQVYEQGQGVAKDDAKAKLLYARSVEILSGWCEHGDARACQKAGHLYAEGNLIGQDEEKARTLQSKALAIYRDKCIYRSNFLATDDCLKAAEFYDLGGNGIEKDDAKAALYYLEAAKAHCCGSRASRPDPQCSIAVEALTRLQP